MVSLRIVVQRLLSPFRRRQLDADLDEEVRTHLELLAADYERRGMTPVQARHAARRAFGGVQQMTESYRDRRGLPWFEILWQDTRYAGRQLRRAPGFALAAIVTLGLAIGAAVTVFTVVDAVLFRQLTYPNAGRLVAMYSRLDPFGRIPVSDSQVRAWRASRRSCFECLASSRGLAERCVMSKTRPAATASSSSATSCGVAVLTRIRPSSAER